MRTEPHPSSRNDYRDGGGGPHDWGHAGNSGDFVSARDRSDEANARPEQRSDDFRGEPRNSPSPGRSYYAHGTNAPPVHAGHEESRLPREDYEPQSDRAPDRSDRSSGRRERLGRSERSDRSDHMDRDRDRTERTQRTGSRRELETRDSWHAYTPHPACLTAIDARFRRLPLVNERLPHFRLACLS